MEKYKILKKINCPDDLKKLTSAELEEYAAEVRSFLIDSVCTTGGHLASNLGTVELTIALHRVFNCPSDHFVFDVGHQAYTHKLITGRREQFQNLRRHGGLSGFTKRSESNCDCFGAGHSSTSLSASLGIAFADKSLGNSCHTIAILGDGAFTGGMIHEALNNIDSSLPLVIVLNENEMSISKNIGKFAKNIARIRTSAKYYPTKRKIVSAVKTVPLIGNGLFKLARSSKKYLKNKMFGSNYFENMGLYYLGPCDGHNIPAMISLLEEAKNYEGACLVHIKTIKGKGLSEAENNPGKFHCIPPKNTAKEKNFSAVAGEELIRIAETDDRVRVVTAAMADGTGVATFADRHPNKFYDVGIAEEHALTFCAGLACVGLKPYFAVYSSFLQRGYDNIIHDIALQNLPVRILVDRCGISAFDGATHHGIFDVSFLSGIPNIVIYTPSCFESLKNILTESLSCTAPTVIRYSNSPDNSDLLADFSAGFIRIDFSGKTPSKLIITYGRIVSEAIKAKKTLTDCGIILLEKLKPYENIANLIEQYLNENTKVVFLEEGIKNGGAGMIIGSLLCRSNYRVLAINDMFESGNSNDIFRDFKIDCTEIIRTFEEMNGN